MKALNDNIYKKTYKFIFDCLILYKINDRSFNVYNQEFDIYYMKSPLAQLVER